MCVCTHVASRARWCAAAGGWAGPRHRSWRLGGAAKLFAARARPRVQKRAPRMLRAKKRHEHVLRAMVTAGCCCVDDVDRWLMATRCSKSIVTQHSQCSGQRKARASEQGDAGGAEVASAIPQPQEARPQQHKRSCLRQVQTEEGKREARRLSSRLPRSSSPHHRSKRKGRRQRTTVP